MILLRLLRDLWSEIKFLFWFLLIWAIVSGILLGILYCVGALERI